MKVYAARMGNKWFNGRAFTEEPDNAKIYQKLSKLKTRLSCNERQWIEDAFDAALLAAGGEIVEFDLVANPLGSIPIDVKDIKEGTSYKGNSYVYSAIYRRDK